MADDKKTISPDVGTPTEVPEQPYPAPDLADATAPAPLGPEALTVEEQLILEHEGQAALFEMGEAVPDPADAVTHAEVEEPAAPEVPKAEKEQEQPPTPGKDAPAPAHSSKVVDFAAAREEAGKTKPPAKEAAPPDKEAKKPEQHRRGRPPKGDKAAPGKTAPAKKDKTTPTKAGKPRDKMSQSKAPATKEEAAAPDGSRRTHPRRARCNTLDFVSKSVCSPGICKHDTRPRISCEKTLPQAVLLYAQSLASNVFVYTKRPCWAASQTL